MAKIAQLVEAGDYLIYKGDWATSTAYNVNDIVTWADDGHLYEVIKAHTSSDTLKPGNTEYYKAMTANQIVSYKPTIINDNYVSEDDYNKLKAISNKIIYAEPESFVANFKFSDIRGRNLHFFAIHSGAGSGSDYIEIYSLTLTSARYFSAYKVKINSDNTIVFTKLDAKQVVKGITFYYIP